VETSLASGREILRGIARYNARAPAVGALSRSTRAAGIRTALAAALEGRWHHRAHSNSPDGPGDRCQRYSHGRRARRGARPAVSAGARRQQCYRAHGGGAFIGARPASLRIFGIEGENWSQQRGAQFAAAVGAAGGSIAVCELPRGAARARSWERVEDRLARWVLALPKPAGVLVCSDQRGAQMLEACRRAGVAVPDEVAVIGVDDDEPLCEVCYPPLSSIQAGHAGAGYEAAALLDSLMQRCRRAIKTRAGAAATDHRPLIHRRPCDTRSQPGSGPEVDPGARA